MIVVTGGAGFIGSAFVWRLNQENIDDIIIVDELGKTDKWKNLVNLRFVNYFHKDDFLQMIYADTLPFEVEAIIHMGAVHPRPSAMPITSGRIITSIPAIWPNTLLIAASGLSTRAPPQLTVTEQRVFRTTTEKSTNSGRSTCTAIPSRCLI